MAGWNRDEDVVSPVLEETASLRKTYGSLVPKKKPLISKEKQDKERAFFDSADWALGKLQEAGVGQKEISTVETLRPKLQRTPYQQLPPRRPSCTSGGADRDFQ